MIIKAKCSVFSYTLVKMKMLLTATMITELMLCTGRRLVVADDQCTRYQFASPFYPGSSCEDIYNKNPEAREVSGYYLITDGLRNVYCGMSYTGLSCGDISITIILKLVAKMDIIGLITCGPFVT